jgi:hypothetical protein
VSAEPHSKGSDSPRPDISGEVEQHSRVFRNAKSLSTNRVPVAYLDPTPTPSNIMCPSGDSIQAIATPGRPRGPPLSTRRTMSFKFMAEVRETQIPGQELLKEERYPVYKLSWEKLKLILEKRFPNHRFEERCVRPCHPCHP